MKTKIQIAFYSKLCAFGWIRNRNFLSVANECRCDTRPRGAISSNIRYISRSARITGRRNPLPEASSGPLRFPSCCWRFIVVKKKIQGTFTKVPWGVLKRDRFLPSWKAYKTPFSWLFFVPLDSLAEGLSVQWS